MQKVQTLLLLRDHFEQCLVVPHRLRRHGAGRMMAYGETASPEGLATAIAEEIVKEVDYRAVPTDGAAKAASMIAELLP